MSRTLIRSAAGLALLAAAIAGCGTATTSHPAGKHPEPAATANARGATHQKVSAAPAPPATTKPAPLAATQPAPPPATHAVANPIPQGNGGDHDADNNGGPSDGDGNI